MKFVFLLLLFINSVLPSKAQKQDRLSDLLLSKDFEVVNHEKPRISLSTYTDRLVILDFWATWCSSCIVEFPKNDSLQKVFGDKVKFILVNDKRSKEDKAKIESFYKKYKVDYPKFSLPSIIKDSVLFLNFNRQTIPYCAWINKGELIAITSPTEVNSENIQALVNGERIKMTSAHLYSHEVPLFKNIDIFTLKSPVIQSTFTGYLDGVGSGNTSMPVNENLERISWRNLGILNQFHKILNFHRNRTLLEVKDSSKYLNDLQSENLFTYELIYPKNMNSKSKDNIILQDLNRYFEVNGRIVERARECWILTVKNPKIIPAGVKMMDEEVDVLNTSQVEGGPIFIDETRREKRVRANLLYYSKAMEPGKMVITDIQQYKKYLNTIGLDITKQLRKIPMFVLSELNK